MEIGPVEIVLTLLSDVRWRGSAVVGDRPRALLAALAMAGSRPMPDDRLVEIIWGDDVPANASNSLQVLVSRTRAACESAAILRAGAGYRLGIDPEETDSGRLSALAAKATAALERDPAAAARSAREALQIAGDLPPVGDDGDPLTTLRRTAAADVAAVRTALARASSRLGEHAAALPDLVAAQHRRRDDEALLADLLRSEAAVRGPAAALERYEDYRRDVRERLGVDPGAALQRLHRELLGQDSPVRTGIRFDATSLIGRDRDVARLQALLDSSRVVSIVGPGGLGKTRLAHVLVRAATQPGVHFVELVGVTAADDVVGEVGSALGVRDSVSSRRILTPRQRADIRGRLVQRLGQAPSLLVLDNCEHLVDAVAELVAALVASCADLHVLTTTRAPLAIAAEQVYLLDQLDAADGAQLFCERARAARPGVPLDPDVVRDIVVRLDGLPLAIELAAAKVRVMAVAEIDRRLENRFALLRGGDRSAPDRHQTLLAVIDWSWNLLNDAERRALRRLALFNDGFTLDAADSMLGDGALEAVQGLVDQSLLSLHDSGAGVRYRMLETVREFGRMQLVDTGEDASARAARRRWAVNYAGRQFPDLMSANQFAAIDAVSDEEINLADELRECIAERDRDALVVLLATLGMFWAIRGEHGRLIAVSGAVAEAIDGWTPPPAVADPARAAMAITLTNAWITREERIGPVRDLLGRVGLGTDTVLSGIVRVLLETDPHDPAFDTQLRRLAQDSTEPAVAWSAYQWLSTVLENSGDPHGAVDAAERALRLVEPSHGPWGAAILHTQLAQLTMQLGDRERSERHIEAAIPVMRRLGAQDDLIQLQALSALCAIVDGDLGLAKERLDRIEPVEGDGIFGGIAIGRIGQAELMLLGGDHAGGLRAYREAADRMREMRWPGVQLNGLEPWVLLGDATALTAHAYYATDADEAHGWALFRDTLGRVRRLLESADPHPDLPVLGAALFGLAGWGLLRDAIAGDAAPRLLALADRFSYNRATPSMAWQRIEPVVRERFPGVLEQTATRYRKCRPRELLDEARTVVEQLPSESEIPLVAAHGQRRENRDHHDAGQ